MAKPMDVAHCLSNPYRRAILLSLESGPKTQAQLTEATGRNQPAVAIGVGYLVALGMVRTNLERSPGGKGGQHLLLYSLSQSGMARACRTMMKLGKRRREERLLDERAFERDRDLWKKYGGDLAEATRA